MADQQERWVPLVAVGRAGLQLGLSVSGHWLVGNSEACVPVGLGKSGVPLLSILERAPSEFLASLATALADHGLPGELARDLPLMPALEAALTGTEYWAALALNWVSAVPFTDQLRTLLTQLSTETWASQTSRHKAKRLLRELGGDGSSPVPR